MTDFVDEVSPIGSGSRGRDSGGQRSARGSIVEDVTVGGLTSRPAGGAKGDVEDVVVAPRGGRSLSEAAQKALAVLDGDAAPAVAAATPETPPPAAPASATTTPAAATATPAPPAPDPAAEHIARADRLAEHNRKLLGELEAHRARPARSEPSAREKALDEAERMYPEDSIGALRRFVAATLGVADPASKEVDAELTGLYQDLTERELGVPLDTAQKAIRESARTRRALERDRRELKAEKEAPAAAPADDTAAKQTAEMSAVIAPLLTAGKHAERYPLLMSLATDFDGVKPEELLWHGIRRGIASGELDAKDSNDKLIDTISRKIEAHYQALADKFSKARPAASTAPPTQATDATATKADPPNGVRTITNASASVAPATPPAAKPAPITEPPKYRNEKERRLAIAQRLLDGAT